MVDGVVVDPPEDFDAVAYGSSSLARVPWTWEVEVWLDLSVDVATRRVPPTLAGLDCDLAIRRPGELRAGVRALATRLERRAV